MSPKIGSGKVVPSRQDLVMIVATNMEDEYLSAIIDNLEFIDNIIFLTDRKIPRLHQHNSKKFMCIVADLGEYSSSKDGIKDGNKNGDKNENENKSEDGLEKLANIVKRKLALLAGDPKRLVGVIGLDEEYRYSISRMIADVFSLEFYPRRILDIASDKHLQKKAMQKEDVRVPRYSLMDISATNADSDKGAVVARGMVKMARQIGYPNVLKPVSGYSSRDVYKNADALELEKNIILLIKEMPSGSTDKFILEEYIGGREYSCDFLVDNGKVFPLRVVLKLIDKGFAAFDGFVLFNPDYCPGMDDNGMDNKSDANHIFSLKMLKSECEKIARSYSMANGVYMTDFKYYDGEIIVLESTVRPGIDTFMDLMARLYGYTSIDILIRQKLRLPIIAKSVMMPKITGASICMLTSSLGMIEKFNTRPLENGSFKHNILGMNKFYGVGDKISVHDVPEEESTSLGYVLLKDVDVNDADSLVRKVNEQVVVRFE